MSLIIILSLFSSIIIDYKSKNEISFDNRATAKSLEFPFLRIHSVSIKLLTTNNNIDYN